MSAPRIPNLLATLRTSKTQANARHTRRHDDDNATNNRIVQQTDDDAAGSRLSAVNAGYMEDAYAHAFAGEQGVLVRRMPIINRGTYVRTTAIDTLVNTFLEKHKGQNKQIISLGAGTDTRFFRLIAQDPALGRTLHYHELDFPSTTLKKIRIIERTPSLLAFLEARAEDADHGSCLKISIDMTQLSSPGYTTHALDIRDLASSTPPDLLGVKPDVPTLILSECCLTYLSPTLGTALLLHITRDLLPKPTQIDIILYEPLHPTDAFGRTMLSNLAGRGIKMPGLEAIKTIEAHGLRLRESGFEGSEGWSVREWWERRVQVEERERLRGCEMVDEEEEWMLLAEHYGVIRGWRN